MNAEQLLFDLRALDIRLFVDGGRLRCSAPKGRLTRALEEKIAAHKPDLVRVLRRSKREWGAIPKRSAPNGIVPLSFAQERFWFLQNLEPESTAYNITSFQSLLVPMDVPVVKAALRAILQRHEILRTNFLELDGVPTQVVRQEVFPELTILDLCHLGDDEKAGTVDAAIQRLSRHKFDLAGEALLRVAVIRPSEQEQLLVVTMHHIICDAWSIGIFFEELKSLYEAYSRNQSVEATELPIQYSDYALWERGRQTSAILAPQTDYWKRKLKDAPRHLDLPTDRSRHTGLTSSVKLHPFELDAPTSESLRHLARQEGATLFMALLAIFKALLSRYTGQNDIVIGTPVSTRNHPELELLVGCFINTHVLRTEVAAGITTKDLLRRVRETVLESLDNADVPFEKLVSELVTERDLSRSPLFQVAFILQNTPMSSAFTVLSGGTDFDMTLYMWEANGLIGGSVEYDPNLFNPETISRFAGCFATLAAEMASQPDAALDRLPVLTAAQEAEWFEGHNGSSASYPRLCAHEWVEQQARETPDAVAVVCGAEQLTYRELSKRSNRLSHRLRALGVGPASLVGLCLDRSTDLVVAPLAVWKAGGAYVPLDPEYPGNRLAFMLEDSGASVLVTESRLLARLPRNVPKVLCLDRDRQVLERESDRTPPPSATPEDLAYVIYTSGSTGKPKGVEIRHRSLVNFLASMRYQPGIVRSDRLLAVTTLSFDIAALELYLPLVSGAQVVIAPRAAVLEGDALAKLLDDFEITIMQATPVTWRLLLEAGWRGTPGLKVLCGGESLTRDLADQLLATGAEVWNLYGPTETTVWSTLQRVVPWGGRVLIGRPIANTQVYIMDQNGQLLPPGVAGELYIGGEGLARGYLRREELTAARFVRDSSRAGKRLYRTGDLARSLPDGSLECLARVDHQVKVRGFRIELGEIEAALEQQPGISQAVVVVREERPGDPRLTAYITARDWSAADPEGLRKALLAVLPEYMIPAAFVHLDQFPLTPNRKVDRKALLSQEYRPRRPGGLPDASGNVDEIAEFGDEDRSRPSDSYLLPSNHVELVMTDIWRDVLDVDRVSIHDNFFALGGHSLSAARLIARLKSTLGMDLPLKCIFIDPTIASLSRHISYDTVTRAYRYTSEIPGWNCLVPAQPRGTRTPLFFVGGYQSPDDTLLVLSRLIPDLGIDQPVFGFRPRWIENTSNAYASVEEMAREFFGELRAVQPEGPYLLGGYCVGGIAALEVARMLLQEGQKVKLLALLDTERPSKLRTFLTDVYFMRQRANHIADVVREIVHPKNQSRGKLIRSLARRKLGIAPSQQSRQQDRFHEAKVRYRRLLYSHTVENYPGRITLIVNEEQARFDRDLGWSQVARGGLDLHTIPGGHDTILTEHGKEVAQVILKSIDDALAETNLPADRVEAGIS